MEWILGENQSFLSNFQFVLTETKNSLSEEVLKWLEF